MTVVPSDPLAARQFEPADRPEAAMFLAVPIVLKTADREPATAE